MYALERMGYNVKTFTETSINLYNLGVLKSVLTIFGEYLCLFIFWLLLFKVFFLTSRAEYFVDVTLTLH